MSQPGKQLCYTLPNISKSKSNPAMKFVNRMCCEKYFSLKIMQKMRQAD